MAHTMPLTDTIHSLTLSSQRKEIMKRLLTALFTTLLTTLLTTPQLMAQQPVGTFSIMPRVGVTLPHLTGKPEATVTFFIPGDGTGRPSFSQGANGIGQVISMGTDKCRRTTGYFFGFDAMYQLTSRLALSAGAGYAFQGTKYEDFGNLAEEDPEHEILICDTEIDLRYITVPLMASYYVAEGLALKAGIQPAFLVTKNIKSKIAVDDNGANYKEKLEGLNSLDLSIPVGLSYEYENVVLDARYNIGLSDLTKDNTTLGAQHPVRDKKKPRNSVFMFTVAYKFTFE